MSKAATIRTVEPIDTPVLPLEAALPGLLRIVVANFAGGVGKTTLDRHLLAPAFPGAKLIRAESINSSGASKADVTVKGSEFVLVAQELMRATKNVRVDIGASNIEAVREILTRLRDVHLDVDAWLVPCTPEAKTIEDTVSTIGALLKLGVEPRRIIVIKNKVVHVETMDVDFVAVEEVVKAFPGVQLLDRPVLEFDIYAQLHTVPGTVDEIALDPRDYRNEARAAARAGESKKCDELIKLEFRRKDAAGAYENLVAVRQDLLKLLVHLSQE